MSIPRVNIYGFPHKGLRNALAQVQFSASKLDITSEHEVAEFKALTECVVSLLELHQSAEDTVVLPSLEEAVPGATQHNAAEHDRLHAMVESIATQARGLEPGMTPAPVQQLADTINAFISNYLTHMAEEEHDMNEVIWAHFSDDAILQWQHQIMAKLTPPQKMDWFRFIIPALNPFERGIMLGGVKGAIPADAYQGILQALTQFMPASDLVPFGLETTAGSHA